MVDSPGSPGNPDSPLSGPAELQLGIFWHPTSDLSSACLSARLGIPWLALSWLS